MESNIKEIRLYGMSIDAAIVEKYVDIVEPYRDAYSDWIKKFTIDYDLDRSPMMWHIELGKPNIDFIGRGWITSAERMVSGRIKRILEKYNLPKHQFTPIDVRYKGEPVEFYMFTIFENHKKYVDWENTVFKGCYDHLCKKKSSDAIFFQNEDDYEKNWRNHLIYTKGDFTSIFPEKFVLKNFSEDVFFMLGVDSVPRRIYLKESVGKELMSKIAASKGFEIGAISSKLNQLRGIRVYESK